MKLQLMSPLWALWIFCSLSRSDATNSATDQAGHFEDASETSYFESVLVVTHLVDSEILLKSKLPKAQSQQDGNTNNNEMETLIRDTFNQRAEAMCDPHQTRLLQLRTDWTALRAEMGRQTKHHESTVISDDQTSSLVALPVQYHIMGICQGCKQDGVPVIFDNDGGSSSIKQEENDVKPERLNCPPNPVSMTREDFQQALQQALQDQREHYSAAAARDPSTKLFFGVSSMIEHVQQQQQQPEQQTRQLEDTFDFPCIEDDPKTVLQSTLVLQLPGDWTEYYTNLTLVEDAFVDVYNRLTFLLCDSPFFRKVTSVSAELGQAGFNDVSNTTQVQFDVQADCRNECPASLALFDFSTTTTTGTNSSDNNPLDAGDPINTGNTSLVDDPTAVVILANRQGPTPCSCPRNVEVDPPIRAPTVAEFASVFEQDVESIYQDLVAAAASEELFTGEIETVACDDDVRIFTSYAFVDLITAGDESSLQESEKQALQDAFRVIYNRLAFLSCDPFFRQVIDATLEEDETVRQRVLQQLQEESDGSYNNNATAFNMTNTTNTTTTTTVPDERSISGSLFSVTGTCRGCPVTSTGSFQLFDDTFRRSLREEYEQSTRSKRLPRFTPPRRNLEEDSCVCPVEVQVEQLSINEFVVSYNEELEDLQEQGVLVSIETVQELQEGQQVGCEGEIRTFTTKVFADVTLYADDLSDEEKSSLEYLFQDTYNSLTFALCDGLFRSVVNVNLDSTGASPLGFRRRGLQQEQGIYNGTSFNATSNATSTLEDVGVQPGDNQGVTPEVFQVAFNDRVKEEQQLQGGSLDAVNVTVDSILEGQEVECGPEPQEFATTVFADVSLDYDELTPEQVATLEGVFQSSYNALAFSVCDSLFRSVVDVSLQTGETARRLQADSSGLDNDNSAFLNTTHNATNTSSADGAVLSGRAAVFSVTGQCRGCPVSDTGQFSLFDDAFRRRRELSEMDQDLFSIPRGLLEAETFCVCPSGVEPGQQEGPTSEVFQVVFSAQVEKERKESGALDGVEVSVDNLIEGQEVNCSSDVQLFTTSVYVDVSLSLEELNDDQKAVLESTFQDTYNDMAFSVCDGLFRSVVGVNLEKESSEQLFSNRQLQETSLSFLNGTLNGNGTNSSSLINETSVGRNTLFSVTGQEKEAGTLGDINVTADAIVEGQIVDCEPTQEEFRSEIFSDLQVNLTSLTVEEVTLLEEAFRDVYNNMAFFSCDTYFRALEEVQLRIGQPEKIFPNRRLEEASNYTSFDNFTNTTNTTLAENSTYAVQTYVGNTLFSVTGSCRNCPVSDAGYFNIFDDAFRRRSLEESREFIVQHTRI
ncbi:expressed unknown protein [Seminavis robusta]|uniref:Uncharacterized protein n=1 Tax=Seminavis robusta TaxID=568900 RepID=A0A9N8E3S6_9STRA|nr:expressed unknown protein [Seminavis robusta]|eukprot:Sro472_g149970.1 n/a (1325) ;mRNA; f:42370-47268